MNQIITRDKHFCDFTKKSLNNTIKRSLLISSVGERERNRFFNLLKNRISKAKDDALSQKSWNILQVRCSVAVTRYYTAHRINLCIQSAVADTIPSTELVLTPHVRDTDECYSPQGINLWLYNFDRTQNMCSTVMVRRGSPWHIFYFAINKHYPRTSSWTHKIIFYYTSPSASSERALSALKKIQNPD